MVSDKKYNISAFYFFLNNYTFAMNSGLATMNSGLANPLSDSDLSSRPPQLSVSPYYTRIF